MVNACDRLALAVIAVFVTAGTLARAPLRALAPLIGIAFAVLAVASLRSRVGRVVHDLSPVPWIIATFEAIGPVIEVVSPRRWDDVFAGIDDGFFGRLAAAWTGALGRPAWLTDLASAAYVLFYAVPVAVGLALYLRGRRREYADFVLSVAFAFFVPFLGYLAFPATGPRVPLPLEDAVLGGGAISRAVRVVLHVVEKNLWDAFPSGHTAVTVVVVARGWSLLPRWRVPLVVIGSLIVFATVYLSFHYVVDIFAGALIAGGVLVARRRWALAPSEAPRAVPVFAEDHQAVKPPST